MTVHGGDFSHFQDKLPSGLDFYFHKCTEGAKYVDAMYAPRAHTVSGVWGAYHFFRMSDSASEQVRNFVAHADIRPGDIVALDFEDVPTDPWSKYTKADVAAKAAEVQHMLHLAYPNNRHVLYCNESTYADYVRAFNIPTYDGLWLADPAHRPSVPFVFWQYTSTPYDLDLSDIFTSAAELRSWSDIVVAPYISPPSDEDETVIIPAGTNDHVTLVTQGRSKLVLGCGYGDDVVIHAIDSWGSSASGWNATPVGVGGHVGEFTLNPNEPLDIDLPKGSVITIVRFTANHSFGGAAT